MPPRPRQTGQVLSDPPGTLSTMTWLTEEELATRNLASTHPGLAAQVHPDSRKTATQVTASSGIKVTWQCPTLVTWPDGTTAPCAHVWEARVANRTHNSAGCPGCAGKAATPWNRLDILHPTIALDWADDRDITTVPSGSAYKANWACRVCTYEWPKAVEKRTQSGYGCPACAGKVATPWRNLATEHPHLLPDWHPDNPHPPTDYTPNSNKRVQWRCSNPVELHGQPGTCGHEWTALINSRASGNGCPGCRGLASTWWNNLGSVRPDLAAQWHPTKNSTLTPGDVTTGSKDRAWWQCDAQIDHADGTTVPCGYEWPSTVDNRNRGKGCSACSGRVVTDRNRLSLLRPDLVAEWHPDNDTSPEDLSFGSDYIAAWRCSNEYFDADDVVVGACGYEWRTKVANRATMGNDCPRCRLASTSRDELHLAFELALFLPVSVEPTRVNVPGRRRAWTIDIAVPELRLAIEYDGAYWHAERQAIDSEKTRDLTRAGWTVIRVREAPLAPVGVHSLIARPARYKETADTVLTYVRDTLGMPVHGLDEYLAAPCLQNEQEARDHIARLLQGQLANVAKRAARNLAATPEAVA